MDPPVSSTPKTYRDFVKFRQQTNPCVTRLLKYLDAPQYAPDSSRIYTTSYAVKQGQRIPLDFEKVNPDDLPSVLTAPPCGQTRLIIVEDIHPRVAELFGSSLDIDPMFFADYVLTKPGDVEMTPPAPWAALAPSRRILQDNWFHIHFQQVADLGRAETFHNAPRGLVTSGNVLRSVRRLPPLSGRQLAIVRGCISVFVKSFDQSWIGLILVDPTTSDAIEKSAPLHSQIRRFARAPLHRGFEDFRDPIPFSTFQSSESPPKSPSRTTCLLEVLIDCFSDGELGLKPSGPSVLNLAYYPLRIAIAQWMLYSRVMARHISYYEYSLRSVDAAVHDERGDMIDLQKWCRQATQSRLKIEATRQFVQYWSVRERDKDPGVWQLIGTDLDLLAVQIEEYGRSLERIIPVVTSMVQLSDARRSMTESLNVKRLTYVALIFVPLSWVAAMFSMAGEYAPGGSKFWMYFAVSLPLCLVIVYGSYLVSGTASTWLNGIWAQLEKKGRLR